MYRQIKKPEFGHLEDFQAHKHKEKNDKVIYYVRYGLNMDQLEYE